MKNFVLAVLLLFCPCYLFAQKISPKEIAKRSLLKMTGGKKLNSFKRIATFDGLGKLSSELVQRNAMLDLLDSIARAAPDSVKKQIAIEMKRANESFYRESTAMHEGQVKILLADLSLKKMVRIRTSSLDTSRSVTGLNQGKMESLLCDNPILMLQYMVEDSVELHYTGATTLENKDCHLVQVKIDGKWIDVAIAKESGLLHRIVIARVDTDPLIGKGPEHYKDIYVFRDYRESAGFLMPSSWEDINTRMDITIKYNLAWSNINEPFPDSTFAREPTPEEKARFRFTDIGNGLFIMELTGQHFGNVRTLVRTNDQVVDLFTGFIYNEVIIDKMRKSVEEKFPGKGIRNIFGAEAISSLSALSGLFDARTKLYFPKGLGYLSEDKWRGYNPKEDSAWRMRFSSGTLHPFETGFEKDGCRAIILNANPNPKYDQWQVCYYLSSQKVIYVNGYLGPMPPGSQNDAPWAKNLCDMVDREALPVEKVICPHGMTRDAPLEMSYEQFRRSVRGQ